MLSCSRKPPISERAPRSHSMRRRTYSTWKLNFPSKAEYFWSTHSPCYTCLSPKMQKMAVLGGLAGFSLGLNNRAQRPAVLFSALSFFLSALSFFQRPVVFREPFGFFGLSSALFWAWSCRKRPIKAKGGAIFVHRVVILGFTININLCKLVRPVVFQD